MAGLKPSEIPAFHGAGKAVAFGDALNVHLLPDHEMIRLDGIAHFQHGFFVNAEFGQLLAGLHFGLGELAALGLVGILGPGESRPELDGGVAILLLGADANDGAAVQLENRDRNMGTVGLKQPCHADLLRDDACAHLTLPTT